MSDLYLVTGGAGFIGSNISEKLVNNGENVRVIDNFLTGKSVNLDTFKDKIEYGKANSNIESLIKATGICPICEKECYGTGYCSTECARYAKRKVDRPTKDYLAELIENKPMTQIGKMYGVSDNAVRKWIK